MWRVVLALMATSVSARADSVRLTGEAGAYLGVVRTGWTSKLTGESGASISPAAGLRASLAVRSGVQDGAIQLGFVFDMMTGDRSSQGALGGVGLSLGGDTPLNPCWRLGGHVAFSFTTYDRLLGAPSDRRSYLVRAGAQARHDYVAIDLDLLTREESGDTFSHSGFGVLAGASLIEKPGTYAFAATAAGGAVVLVLAAIALSQVKYSD